MSKIRKANELKCNECAEGFTAKGCLGWSVHKGDLGSSRRGEEGRSLMGPARGRVRLAVAFAHVAA